MKFLVLILSLVGIAGSGFLGFKWYTDLENAKNDPTNKVVFELVKAAAQLDEEAKKKYDHIKRLELTAYVLMGGAAVSLISLLALGRNGMILGLIFCVCGGAPLVTSQDPKLAIFTGALILAGLLALLFLRPLPETSGPKSSN